MFLQSSDRLRTCWPLNRMQAMFRGCNATSWPVYKYGRKIISCIWVPRWYSILPPMTFDLCANSLQVSFAFDCPRQRTLPWSPKTAAGSWRNRLPWDDSAISQVAQEAAAVICAPKLLPDGRDCILFFLIVKKKTMQISIHPNFFKPAPGLSWTFLQASQNILSMYAAPLSRYVQALR